MRMEPTEFRNVGYQRYMDAGDLPKRQQITNKLLHHYFIWEFPTGLGTYTLQLSVEFTHQKMHFFNLKKHIKIYIKIHINIAPTCFDLPPPSASLH